MADFGQDGVQMLNTHMSLSPQFCVMRRNNSESVDHLFIHCPEPRPFGGLFSMVGFTWILPRGSSMTLFLNGVPHLPSNTRPPWQI